MNCECFSREPTFNNNDDSLTCIYCGITCNNTVYYQPPSAHNFENQKCLKNNQLIQIKTYIDTIQNKIKKNFDNTIVRDIYYLYELSVETYKKVNDYKKIKYTDVFFYLSSLYVLKSYKHLEAVVYLVSVKPKSINKFNKIYYLISQSNKFKNDYGKIHNIDRMAILFDDYSWVVYDILKENNKLHLYDNIYLKVVEKLKNDDFISSVNLKKYILNTINNV